MNKDPTWITIPSLLPINIPKPITEIPRKPITINKKSSTSPDLLQDKQKLVTLLYTLATSETQKKSLKLELESILSQQKQLESDYNISLEEKMELEAKHSCNLID